MIFFVVTHTQMRKHGGGIGVLAPMPQVPGPRRDVLHTLIGVPRAIPILPPWVYRKGVVVPSWGCAKV